MPLVITNFSILTKCLILSIKICGPIGLQHVHVQTEHALTALSVQYVKNDLRFIDIDLQHIHQIIQISEHLS